MLHKVLISSNDDQSSIFELALSLTKMYDHGVDTLRAVLGEKCCTVKTALDILQEIQEESYELCINHVNNNVDLGDLDDLWDLISSNADPEEVGFEFRLNYGGQHTPYGFLVKIHT